MQRVTVYLDAEDVKALVTELQATETAADKDDRFTGDWVGVLDALPEPPNLGDDIRVFVDFVRVDAEETAQ